MAPEQKFSISKETHNINKRTHFSSLLLLHSFIVPVDVVSALSVMEQVETL